MWGWKMPKFKGPYKRTQQVTALWAQQCWELLRLVVWSMQTNATTVNNWAENLEKIQQNYITCGLSSKTRKCVLLTLRYSESSRKIRKIFLFWNRINRTHPFKGHSACLSPKNKRSFKKNVGVISLLAKTKLYLVWNLLKITHPWYIKEFLSHSVLNLGKWRWCCCLVILLLIL